MSVLPTMRTEPAFGEQIARIPANLQKRAAEITRAISIYDQGGLPRLKHPPLKEQKNREAQNYPPRTTSSDKAHNASTNS